MADRRAGPTQGPYVPSPGGGKEPRGVNTSRASEFRQTFIDRRDWRNDALTLVDGEYVALTQLQADAFLTLDVELARSVEGIVATASIDALR